MLESQIHREPVALEDHDHPVSVSHFVHTLTSYASTIWLALAAVAILYAIIALSIYLWAPSQRITRQPFRLDFHGATNGTYPDGLRFSTTEIVAPPVLVKVFHDNDLGRFTSYEDFSRSVFVTENNPDYERLAIDYEARLADSRLSSVDRERIQAEWQSRLQGLTKNEYALVYVRPRTRALPETVVRKVLGDLLTGWANFAIKERHVLEYRMAVMAPEMISRLAPNTNPVIAAQILRSKTYRMIDNIGELENIPSADLVRTSGPERRSLAELRLGLEEIVRFRIEPLVTMVRLSSPDDRARTIATLRTQLAYDQRHLKAAQEQADGIRQSIALYMNQSPQGEPSTPTSASNGSVQSDRRKTPQSGESIMPQLSETFLDKLLTLTNQANDIEYRRRLVDDYRKAQAAVVPAQDAVDYDRQVIDGLASEAGRALDTATANQQLTDLHDEVRKIVASVNEIYQILSRNLNPSGELFSITAPATTRMDRTISLARLFLYGVVILLVAIPLIVTACLLHNRVREEDEGQAVSA